MHRPINIRFIRFQSSPRSRAYRTFGCSSSRSRTRVTLNHSSLPSSICYTHARSSALLSHASSRPPTTHPRSFVCSTLPLKFTTTDPHPLCTRPFMLTFTLSLRSILQIHAHAHSLNSSTQAQVHPRASPSVTHHQHLHSAPALRTFTRARTVG